MVEDGRVVELQATAEGAPYDRSEFEMFEHRQVGPDLAFLRTMRDPHTNDLAGRHVADFGSLELNRPGKDRVEPRDRSQDG